MDNPGRTAAAQVGENRRRPIAAPQPSAPSTAGRHRCVNDRALRDNSDCDARIRVAGRRSLGLWITKRRFCKLFEYHMDFCRRSSTLRLYVAADGASRGWPVENFVGKDSRTLIPGIRRPNLFIHFQESSIGKESGAAGFAPAAGAVLEAQCRAARRAPRCRRPASPLYPWIKALHIVAVVELDGGALLPAAALRLSRRARRRRASELSETFKVMEARLLRQIMRPAMIATWLFGMLLALTPGRRLLGKPTAGSTSSSRRCWC